MKRNSVLTIIICAVVAFACGFGGCVAAFTFLSADDSTGTSQITQIIENSAAGAQSVSIVVDPDANLTTAEAIAAKVIPSVVGITTTYTTTSSSGSSYGFNLWSWGFGNGGTSSYDSSSEGTGVIIDERGYILTNAHVINDGTYKSISISLDDGRTFEAEALWYDATIDLAVLKIEADGLVAAELGDSDTINIGAYAAVIGNPLGLQYERSISQGIISGLNRTITVSSSSSYYSSSSSTTMQGLIQTDAAINSGNSGGPLLNAAGQVIGIATAKASSGESMGFAIPINTAKPIIEQILTKGSFERAYLGISGIGLEESGYTTSQLISQFGVSSGIYVSSVSTNGGAKAAGLKDGDIITKIDGTEVGTMNKVTTLLVAKEPGDIVTVTYLRDGKEYTADITLTGTTPNA